MGAQGGAQDVRRVVCGGVLVRGLRVLGVLLSCPCCLHSRQAGGRAERPRWAGRLPWPRLIRKLRS